MSLMIPYLSQLMYGAPRTFSPTHTTHALSARGADSTCPDSIAQPAVLLLMVQ